jgi:hypothetical protein
MPESIPGGNPFNRVKADFAILLIVGLILLFVSGRLFDSEGSELAFLGVYSCAGALWLVLRARRIEKRMRKQQNHGQE